MCASLERPDAVELPATQESADESLAVGEKRYFPDVVERQAVANIEYGIAPVEIRLGLVGGICISSGRPINARRSVLPGRPIIYRVAVSIISTELKPMT